jgi:BirA family transcriptional regulator, biotin operon repressor / biotin---[acetyl-CoA-carboxylase] ligase
MLPGSATRRLAATRFVDVRWFASLASTNTYLLDQARSGAPDGVVAVADHQTAGRGRLGRSWVAPPRSALLASVLLRPDDLAVDRAHLLTAAVALAAAEACEQLSGVRPSIKWPNDLLVGDRKLAGILAEVELGAGPSLKAVVVGIGLNVAWSGQAPPEVAGLAVALDEVSGRVVDRDALLVEMLLGLEWRYGDLNGVASEYRSTCATVGRRVRVELMDGGIEGVAADITPDGRLLIVADDGSHRTVTAGDVVHLRPGGGDTA